MIEVWKPIPSFPLYEASSLGRVRSRFRVLKQTLRDDGYYTVKVAIDGEYQARPVHVLVCEAFHGPKKYTVLEVAHNSGVKSNNRPSNLRWDIQKVRSASVTGEKHPRALFTQAQVDIIRARYRRGDATIRALAGAFDVTTMTIRNIVTGKSWSASFKKGAT